ncbi:accessory gene regulator B family protein [Paraclostridium sordellii]|uniref:accessory gene regulator B family protein n=1 Tax=Paraclostridium sordellii TaxID=1505 RepID=UPI0005E23A25|nr:accessory gene regulator B family protein [Paeniclostridium sordellii]QYE98985.1 accessory gene regulator B family protein [Paeniclostridium sordellii]CEN77765.1 accessory gene regulator B superfamily [[Clostridium] sordellii] [Paeniclostridium sordellii]CEO06550.1 accessory gene regulator B superfamily [[Clostridium] sordellii] [Paeniclostridium sordellii]CEP86577.1 accessory gene regulator B superfamily [[Clostridium] sordellii] [Paeniclostridium sordellii]CEP96828.1 accessory gene regula
MMMKKFDNFVESICKYNKFPDEQTEEIKYIMRIISLELIKLLLVIILFSVFGYSKEILLVVGVMICTRPFTGGYHESSQKRCLVATIILSLLIIILSENSSLNTMSIIVINAVNIFSVYNQAPIVNACMPITKESLIRKNKKIAIVNYIVLFAISIFLYKYTLYRNIITWTLTLNVCLMFNQKKHKGA